MDTLVDRIKSAAQQIIDMETAKINRTTKSPADKLMEATLANIQFEKDLKAKKRAKRKQEKAEAKERTVRFGQTTSAVLNRVLK